MSSSTTSLHHCATQHCCNTNHSTMSSQGSVTITTYPAGNGGHASGSVNYLKVGYLRKQKTMKKKWFVLKPETPDSLARLEYYDDEKKWRKNQQPKRSIILKTCFNINKHKRQDIKQKFVIDLYTKDDCFSIVFDNEDELEEWLRPMLFLQHGEELWDGEPPKPTFEHVWSVDVMDRGLGSQSKIRGAYRLCLTDKQLSLIPNGNSKLNTLEFSLMGIRRCGATDSFLYIEVGRSSVTGEGDIYMQTTDSVIASNMNVIIREAMSNSKKDELGPKQRVRSSSATESSKPVTLTSRRPYKPIDSPLNAVGNNYAAQHLSSAGGNVGAQHQPPVHTHHQRTHSLPVSPADSNTQIMNENNNNYAPMGGKSTSSLCTSSTNILTSSYSSNNIQQQPPITHITTVDQVDCYTTRRGSTGNNRNGSTKRHNRTGSGMTGVIVNNCLSALTGRERCDSLPTRARTASESQTTNRSLSHRPKSMYTQHDGPASPPSNCSTDSAGSSFSIDETDWGDGPSNDNIASRYGHSLTPDEHVIFEENDEWNQPSSLPKNSPNVSSGIHSESPSGASCASSPLDINDGYVPMHPCDTGYVPMQPLSSPASTCSVTSGTPSTDLRFSEYTLDKISSYILPMEDGLRSARTYSVGERPKRVQQNQNLDQTRARAFSVGAQRPTRRNLKSSSDPSALPAGSPMGDLMELDFTHNSPQPVIKNNGYVEMWPLGSSQNSNSPYVDMRPKEPSPYVDMGGSLSTSPNKAINYSPYVDMSGKSASPKQDDYMVMNLSSRSRGTPDGYMEMNFKTPRKPTLSQSSNASAASDNSDYLNMGGSKTSISKKKERRMDKARSKPIAIQQNVSSPPKQTPNYLPLNTHSSPSNQSPFSSLHRRTRTSSKNPETPTSVFPMSLSNSSGFHTPDNSRKCPVDARSGTVKIYSGSMEDDYAPMEPVKAVERTPITPSREEDYTEIGFETATHTTTPLKVKDTSEYVNYNPAAKTTPRAKAVGDDSGEYAIMRPVHANNRRVTPFRKTSIPAMVTTKSNSRPNLPKQQSQQVFKVSASGGSSATPCCSHQVQIVKPGANMTNHPQSSFKPITANLPKVNCDKKFQSTSPKTIDNLLTRQLSSTNDSRRTSNTSITSSAPSSTSTDLINCSLRRYSSQCSDSSSGSSEVMLVTTPSDNNITTKCTSNVRPSSVNSDTITTSSPVAQTMQVRPSSVNSEKVTRPSSIFSDTSLSRSRPSSSSSDLNSSSSTLVGSRPPSVSSLREVVYITLEHEDAAATSPRCLTTQVTKTCQVSGTSVVEENTQTGQEVDSTIPYTAIDFEATDELKASSVSVLPKH